MESPITRDELFALAAKPIGDRELQHAGNNPEAVMMDPRLTAAAKRASKVWLPLGKQSANTNAAREAERELKARNFDLEDAIAAAGGERGHVNPA